MTLPTTRQLREPNPCENGCGRAGFRAIVSDPRVLCEDAWTTLGVLPREVGAPVPDLTGVELPANCDEWRNR